MNFGKLVKIFHFFIKKIQRPAGLGEIQQGDLNSAVFRGPFPRFSAESAGFRAFPRIRRNPTDSDGFRRILRNPSDSDGMSSKIENFAKFQISTLGVGKFFFQKFCKKSPPSHGRPVRPPFVHQNWILDALVSTWSLPVAQRISVQHWQWQNGLLSISQRISF